MTSTPPEASIEYSRGSGRPRPTQGRVRGAAAPVGGVVGGAILAGGLIGAVLLLVSEFTTLFVIRTSASSAPVRTVGTGSHHSYALVLIAVLVGLLTYAVRAAGSRAALLAIGVLGLVTLLIALLGDLPDAHASGLIATPTRHYISAAATPSTGLYLETLGAVVLIGTCVCGFLLIDPPAARAPRSGVAQPSRRDDLSAS